MGKKLNSDIIAKLYSYEYMYNYYIIKNLSTSELALEMGVGNSTIKRHLKKLNITKDKSFVDKMRISKCREAMRDKYNVENASQLGWVKDKIEKTCLVRYGGKSPFESDIVQAKIKNTNIERYGVDNPIKNELIRNKIKETNKKKYGVDYPLMSESKRILARKTMLETYGAKTTLEIPEFRKRLEKALLEKYGAPHALQSKALRAKASDTLFRNFGVRSPCQSQEIKERMLLTKDKNKSFNTSIPENLLFILLETLFGIDNVKRSYNGDARYPFRCDFYIPSHDLFIEFQGSWVHGVRPYDGSNIPLEWSLKKDTSTFYINAINTYTVRDPLKRKIALKNNLNYLEIWHSDFLQGIPWLVSLILKQGLPLKYSSEILKQELRLLKNNKGSFGDTPRYNKIIENFQQHFYKKERSLWNNPFVREKLVVNREKYKKRPIDDISIKQVLQGFKISGMHVGYSFFSPTWLKSFVTRYSINSMYDPCAGWGHRLLGAHVSGVYYVGNDLSSETYKGLCDIKDFFDIDCELYCEPAEKLVPNFKVDAIFTCPPYYTTEIYEGKDTSTSKYKDYFEWVNNWWVHVVRNSLKASPSIFSFVINNKYKQDMVSVVLKEGLSFKEEIRIGNNQKNHFQRTSENSLKGESLLVFGVP